MKLARIQTPVMRSLVGCLLWIALFICSTEAMAQKQTQPDYRATPAGKLEAAKRYVAEFLVNDANPKEVFFIRQISFPVWKDQPIRDCNFDGLVRWIEPQEPYFEDKKQEVVIVPVWAELLMARIGGVDFDLGWGTDRAEDGKSWCKWEYERYNPATQQFEKMPQFRKRSYSEEFAEWGESNLGHVSPRRVQLGVAPRRTVAIGPGKRIVRYFIRVSVKREQAYRLTPQVPRHWYAQDAIVKLDRLIESTTKELIAGVSGRGPTTSVEELKEDLDDMMHQREEMRWKVRKLREILTQPESHPSYPELNNSTNSK